jgi:quinoprotein glucose dehydrogenase
VQTGRRLWHFQTIHHDLWDLDNVSAPQLVTVTHDGKKVDVVAHAGKTGFLYVFNRVTGEPLWPIEERPVGKSTVPYELAWPTQPFPTKPPAFARQSFTADEVDPWLLEPEEYEEIRQRVLMANNSPGPQGGLFVPTVLNGDAISMPGNQGGSNWGTTAADPERGLVFVTTVNSVAILRVNDIQDPTAGGLRSGGGGAQQFASAQVQQGQRAYMQYCAACHGQNQLGAMAGVPPVAGITESLDAEALRLVINEGRNTMRPILDVTTQEAAAIHAFLAATAPAAGRRGGGGRGRGGAEGVTFPPGPVVASGGAPAPPIPEPYSGPLFPGAVPGTTGNMPWPADVEAATLPTRYQSGYNVMGSATGPPHATITAYDLNTGEIRWQVPNGDDPNTVAAGGPRETGGVGARYGMVVTDTGLLFQLTKAGTARAYDVDTGKVLWEGEVAGPSQGIPAMYMSKGKQYVVFRSPAQGGGGRGGAPAGPTGPCGSGPNAEGPCGYIAFALPN